MTKAFDYFLRGWTFYLYFRRDANLEARRMYEEAIRADPKFVRAHAELAFSMLHAWLFNWDASVTMDRAKAHVDAALRIDPEDYYSQWISASCDLYRRDFDRSSASYDRALVLAQAQAIPDDIAALRVDRAEMLMLTGRTGEAIGEIESVLGLPGHIPEKWYFWVQAWAYYDAGRYRDSLRALGHISQPRNAMRKNLIASHVGLGDLERARTEAARFLGEEKSHGIVYAQAGGDVLPGLLAIEDRLPFKNPGRLKHWKDHLSEAFRGLTQP